jgi:hypothetical protein
MKAAGKQIEIKEDRQDGHVPSPPSKPGNGILVQYIVHQGKVGSQPKTIQQGRAKSLMVRHFLDSAHADDAEADPAIEPETFYIKKGFHLLASWIKYRQNFPTSTGGSDH